MSVYNLLAVRAALAFAAWVAVTPLATGDARAQFAQGHAPWCADLSVLDGATLECAYFTFEQCMARASGISNHCSVNPWYVPERPRARRQHRDPRRSR
jgi:hypothetical protein